MQTFTERLSKSFNIFKLNFVTLFKPYLFNILVVLVFILAWVFSYFVFWPVIWSVLIVILFLLFLLSLPICVIFMTKTLKLVVNQEEFVFKDVLNFSLKNFLSSYKTYAFIFYYTSLLLCIYLIIAWLFYLYVITSQSFSWLQIWLLGWFWTLVLIPFIFFVYYRIFRSIFAIYHAVSEEDFSYDNFKESLSYTEWNAFDIFWNVFLIWLISVAISMVFTLIHLVFTWKTWTEELFNNWIWIKEINSIVITVIQYIFIFTFWLITAVFKYLMYVDFKNEHESLYIQE